jgi:hypothetical protein
MENQPQAPDALHKSWLPRRPAGSC